MIRKLLKFVIGVIALSWLAKKMHHHRHEGRKGEPFTRKLREYMEK
jgi:hypothetical protein